MIVSIIPLWAVWLGELAIKRLREGAPAHAPTLAPQPILVTQSLRLPARVSKQQPVARV